MPDYANIKDWNLYMVTGSNLQMAHYHEVIQHSAYGEAPLTTEDLAGLDLFEGFAHLVPSSSEVEEDLDQAEQEFLSYLNHVHYLQRRDMYGQSYSMLAYIAYRRGKHTEARQLMEQALQNGLEQGFFLVMLLCLAVLGLMLAEAGEIEEAAELYATANAHPFAGNSQWFKDVFGDPIARRSVSLPAEVLASAQARGVERDYFEVGQEWLERLRSIEGNSFFPAALTYS